MSNIIWIGSTTQGYNHHTETFHNLYNKMNKNIENSRVINMKNIVTRQNDGGDVDW
uniref:Uncharacterized protein n=1 Tax=Arion vulgaris TaxID=1028688 RepID=A0A0B7AW05_9EUPU